VDVIGLFILLGVGLAAGWVMLVAQTVISLTRPTRRTYGWAVARSLPGDPSELRLPGRPENEEIKWSRWAFNSGGRELPVWDITGLDAAGPVAILTHGWGDSRTVMLGSGRIGAALPWVSRLIVWDMPGHGDAPGRCSLGLREPGALRALIERVADAGQPVVLWGFSLGARVSIHAAESNPAVRAVIAEAPYLLPARPARNVLRLRGLPYRSNLPPALMLLGLTGARARELDACALRCPLLVIHGVDDAVSPIEDGRRLAAGATQGRLVEISGGNHQTLWFAPETAGLASQALREFLSSLQGLPLPPPR
jgi:pimeloyl-ACP methyl ester carboxylesterase